LTSSIWLIVGSTMKAPVQRSRSITSHSSRVLTRRTNTFVPPRWKTGIVTMNVPRWNSGPEFKNTYRSSMSCTKAMTRLWASRLVCVMSEPLGLPSQAAVYTTSTGRSGSTAPFGSVTGASAMNAS
jgi:hypothetical protein